MGFVAGGEVQEDHAMVVTRRLLASVYHTSSCPVALGGPQDVRVWPGILDTEWGVRAISYQLQCRQPKAETLAALAQVFDFLVRSSCVHQPGRGLGGGGGGDVWARQRCGYDGFREVIPPTPTLTPPTQNTQESGKEHRIL